MKIEKNFRNRVVDINDPNVPGYTVVGITALMAYTGTTTEASVYRAINRGDLPPAHVPGQWTVQQVREWKVLLGRLANFKVIQQRAKELGLKYTDLTEFDIALNKTKDSLDPII